MLIMKKIVSGILLSLLLPLLLAVAKKFKPAAGLDEAVDILKEEGIISSVAYWKQHAVAGDRRSGATVARLINKIAQRLKTK